MSLPHSLTRRRALLSFAAAAGLTVIPALSATANTTSAPSSPGRSSVAAGATPGSECTIRVETTSTTGDDLDYFLGGVVDATGAGCVVTEPGDFRGSVGFYPDPTDDEIQTAVDFIQGGGDSIPCNQFFAIPFAGYFLSVFCPN